MKIFVLPASQHLRPESQPFTYPKHNADYGVEQDFFKFIQNQNDLLTDHAEDADWHYLPVYWTRWHLNHDYGKAGISELQSLVNSAIISYKKTFTICQYDDGPQIDLNETTQFLASRKSSVGTDIPLLCSPHTPPLIKPRKKYFASFVGRITTHPLRIEMNNYLKERLQYHIQDFDFDTKSYVRSLLSSLVALAPRGYGGSSFRFFEAMQLGVVPFLIGEHDTRPFKKWINWNKFSFYTEDPKNIDQILVSITPEKLMEMGKLAKKIYYEELTYGKWCKYILMELDEKE